MKLIIENEKQSKKKVKRPYIKVSIGRNVEPRYDIRDYDNMLQPPFVYDSTKQEQLVIEDRFISRAEPNKVAVFAYKSEKQYMRYAGQKGETARIIFNILMIVFTIVMIIFTFGLFFAYFGKKKDPALRFYYSFVYDTENDIKLIISGRRMRALPVNNQQAVSINN